MKIKSLCLALAALAPVALYCLPPQSSQNIEEPQAPVVEEQQAPKTEDPLRFKERDNRNLMILLEKFMTKKEAEHERSKFADALFAARKANILRTAEYTVEKFSAEADVLVGQLTDFLAMLDMARSIIEESFDRSSIVNYDAAQRQGALLLQLIGKEEQEQRRMLKDAQANAEEFRRLLDQLSAVNEVLVANLTGKFKKAIQPYMQERIAAEKAAAEQGAPRIVEESPTRKPAEERPTARGENPEEVGA